jgi:cobalt-zinc-cadmium efflux system membrane fusion protein
MKSVRFSLSIIITGSILFLASCNRENKSSSEKIEVLPEDMVELRDDQIKLAGVETGSVVIRTLGNAIRVNGIVTVAPQSTASVCMPLGGFIKNTMLLPGNAVAKGQTLALIENQDFVDIQQNYLEAKNKLVYAKGEYERHTDLYNNEVYSKQNVQEVTVEYKNLVAMVKSLEQKLLLIGMDPGQVREDNITSTINLVSPIKGYLKSVNINIGKYVAPTDVLFEIVNSDKLFLELTLFEKDAGKVSAGQKLKFQINNETEEHEAIVTQTGKSITNDKTLLVYAAVEGYCKNVLPGMYVNASIEETGKTVTTLPSDAIVSFDDKDYIFVFEKQKEEEGKPFTEYRMIEVKKGASSSGFTEIMLPEGFEMKTAIVIKGAYNLLSAKKNAGEMAC